MAGFEVIVRPVVFPSIRPQAPRSLPPEDDPEKGFAVIRGNPATVLSLSYSYSFSASSSGNAEVERDVDEVRVYQEEDDGTINEENFVDVEVAKKIKKKGVTRANYGNKSANYGGGITQEDRWVERFKKVEEKANIEIRNRNVTKKNENANADWDAATSD